MWSTCSCTEGSLRPFVWRQKKFVPYRRLRMSYYRTRTRFSRGRHTSRLFVAMQPNFPRDVTLQSFSRWVKQAFRHAYNISASDFSVRAHEVRAWSAFLAFRHSVPLADILVAPLFGAVRIRLSSIICETFVFYWLTVLMAFRLWLRRFLAQCGYVSPVLSAGRPSVFERRSLWHFGCGGGAACHLSALSEYPPPTFEFFALVGNGTVYEHKHTNF